ncbi:hypothetical protein BKA62DRAFT_608023, partial [Auriculariales sp. MPI-PUGE-AT-0066]
KFLEWLSTTDSELTFIGQQIDVDLAKHQQSVRVVYYSFRQNTVWSCPHTAYNGGPSCINAP